MKVALAVAIICGATTLSSSTGGWQYTIACGGDYLITLETDRDVRGMDCVILNHRVKICLKDKDICILSRMLDVHMAI